jgi:hypothetical protein
MVFEYELVYQLNATDNGTAEGNKIPAPDSVQGTAIRDLGNDKEGYRWTFLIKNNEDRDDYSRVMQFAKWNQLTGTAFTSQISTYLDVDQWLRGVAANVLPGAGDSYGGDGAQHNVQFYARRSDGRMLYFPHDMDAFYSATRGAVPNGDVAKIISVPVYARMYYGHLREMIATTYNLTYMTRWANHFGQLLPAQPFASHLAFIGQRAASLTSAINSAVPNAAFAITSNGGNDANVATDTFTLTGNANLDIMTIMVNGVSYPITWTTVNAWSVTVPLVNGLNHLTVQGVDRFGISLGANALDTVNITTTGSGAPLPVKINEWASNNAGPGGFPDPADGLFQDWIELYNPNAAPVVLTGCTLTDNLSLPAKWTFPAGTTIAGHGFLLVWADNQTGQNAPGSDLHASFQLDADGESIGLYNASGVAQHTLSFGPQDENVSEGLFPDGDVSATHVMKNWTPRSANTLAGPLQFTTVTRAGGVITLTWNTIPGRTYHLEFASDPAGPWSPLGTDTVAAGDTATATDSAGGAARRFYRARRVD